MSLSLTEITEAWRQLQASEREGWRYADELEKERVRLNKVNNDLLEALKFCAGTSYIDDAHRVASTAIANATAKTQ
jgi:hypothetical protein